MADHGIDLSKLIEITLGATEKIINEGRAKGETLGEAIGEGVVKGVKSKKKKIVDEIFDIDEAKKRIAELQKSMAHAAVGLKGILKKKDGLGIDDYDKLVAYVNTLKRGQKDINSLTAKIEQQGAAVDKTTKEYLELYKVLEEIGYVEKQKKTSAPRKQATSEVKKQTEAEKEHVEVATQAAAATQKSAEASENQADAAKTATQEIDKQTDAINAQEKATKRLAKAQKEISSNSTVKFSKAKLDKAYQSVRYKSDPKDGVKAMEGVLEEFPDLIASMRDGQATLEGGLKSVNEMVSRMSQNASVAKVAFGDMYHVAAEVGRQLSQMYDDGIRDTEEYITLQYKLMNIIDSRIKSAGGVRGFDEKNKFKVEQHIFDAIYQDTGYDIGTSSAIDAIWGQEKYSIFQKQGNKTVKRPMRELAGDLLDYKGTMVNVDGGQGVKWDYEELKRINFVLGFIAENMQDVMQQSASAPVVKTLDLLNMKAITLKEELKLIKDAIKDAYDSEYYVAEQTRDTEQRTDIDDKDKKDIISKLDDMRMDPDSTFQLIYKDGTYADIRNGIVDVLDEFGKRTEKELGSFTKSGFKKLLSNVVYARWDNANAFTDTQIGDLAQLDDPSGRLIESQLDYLQEYQHRVEVIHGMLSALRYEQTLSDEQKIARQKEILAYENLINSPALLEETLNKETELASKIQEKVTQINELAKNKPEWVSDDVVLREMQLEYYKQEKSLLQELVVLRDEYMQLPLPSADKDLKKVNYRVSGQWLTDISSEDADDNIKWAQQRLDAAYENVADHTTPSGQIGMFVGMADPIFEAADATHQLAGAMQEVVDVHPNQVSFDELLDLYHAGDLSNIANTLKSFPLGNVPPRKGNGICGLTGLYTTDDVSGFWGTEWHGAPISTIDPSGYKLLNARSDEIADKVGGFLNDLNATIYGYYEAIDEKDWTLKRYADVKTIEELYAAHNELFAESTLSMEQFAQFINGAKEKIVGKSFADIQLPAIDEGIAKSGISSALQDVADELFNSDSFQTQFLKMLGYEGVDLRGTKYNGTYSGGSVIFDPRQESLKATNEKWSDFMSRHGYEIGEDDLRHEEKRRQLAFETAKAYSKQSEESSKLLDQSQAQAKAEASIAESAQEAVKFKLETSRDADIKEQLQLFDDGLGELTTDMLSIDPSGQLQSQMQQKIQDARNKVENGLLETADAYVEIVGDMGTVFAEMQESSDSVRKLTNDEYSKMFKGVSFKSLFSQYNIAEADQSIFYDEMEALGEMVVSQSAEQIQGQVEKIVSHLIKSASIKRENEYKTMLGDSAIIDKASKILYDDDDVKAIGKDTFSELRQILGSKLTKSREKSRSKPDQYFAGLTKSDPQVLIDAFESEYKTEWNANSENILRAIAVVIQKANEEIFQSLDDDGEQYLRVQAESLIGKAIENVERLAIAEKGVTAELEKQNVVREDGARVSAEYVEDAEAHRPNIVEHEVEKKIQQLRDANNNDKALINFKGAFTQEDLLKEFQSFAQNVDGLDLDVGKITIQGDTAHVQLYNDALKTTIDQTWRLKEASEEAGTTLEFVDQRYRQNVKALKESNFDVDGVKAVAKSRVEKLKVDADRAKYDLTELDQLADSIASQDDFKKFNHQLEAAKNNIDAIKKATVTEHSMNQLANMQRDMQNANLELDTMHLKLQKLGDLEGVEKAEGTISSMRKAVEAFNDAKNADEQKKAYNKYSDLRSQFNAQMRYLNALKSVAPSSGDSDAQNYIEKYYQNIVDSVKKINDIDVKINDLKLKDGGKGVYANMIQALETDKSHLLDRISNIGDEINQEFSGVFKTVGEGDRIELPFNTLLNDMEQSVGSETFATLLNFLNDADVQSTLTTEKINKLVQAFQQSQNIKFDFGTKIASQFNDVYTAIDKLQSISDAPGGKGIISQDSDAYQSALNAYENLLKMQKEFGSDTSKWSASQIAAFTNASKQIVDYTNIITKAAEKEARYFAGRHQYDPNSKALMKLDDKGESKDSSRKKLEDFVKEFENGQGVITDFKTSADGISRIDFSFFDKATGQLRTFYAELGQFTDGFYPVETTMKNLSSGTDAAVQSFSKLGASITKMQQIEGSGATVQELTQMIQRLQDAMRAIGDSKDVGSQNMLKGLSAEADQLVAKANKAYQAWEKIQEAIDAGKMQNLGQINKDGDVQAQMFEKIQQAAGDAKISIQGFDAEAKELKYTLTSADGTVTSMVASLHDLNNVVLVQESGTRKLKTAWQDIGGSLAGVGKELGKYAINMMQVMDVVRYLKTGFKEVLSIDTALTELRKVTDETDATYSRFLQTMSKTGAVVGSTVKDLTTSAADWARLGYSIEEAGKLAENTMVLMNVSEFDNVTDATDTMISAIQAFKDQDTDVGTFSMDIIDMFNKIGNSYAISTSDLADSLTRSSASLVAANNSIEQAIALTTAANTTIQNPEVVGTTLKTLSMRIRGVKTELEEAGEDTEGMIANTSKLQAKVQALTNVDGSDGINILTDSGDFKSTYDILLEISKVWKQMNDMDQAALLEIIAGKRAGSAVASILSNGDILRNAYNDALNADGSAQQELNVYLDSVQGKLDQLNNSTQTMWMNFMNSDVLKFLIDLANGAVKLTDNMGLLNVAVAAFVAKTAFNSDSFGKIVSPSTIQNIFDASRGINGMTVATKGATIAANALNAVLSSFISLGIGLAIGLIVKGFDALIDTTEELKEKSEEAITAYTDSHKKLKDMDSTINDISDDYSRLSVGVDELGHNINLTASEYERYNSIVNQIADMFPEMVRGYTAEGNAIIKNRGSVEALTAAYEALEKQANATLLNSARDIMKNYNHTFSSDWWENGPSTDANKIQAANELEKMLNDRDIYDVNAFYGDIPDGIRETMVDLLENAGIAKKSLVETEKDYIDNAINDFPHVVQSIINSWNSVVNSAVSNVRPLIDAYLTTSDGYKDLSDNQKSVFDAMVSSFDHNFLNQFEGDAAKMYQAIENMILNLKSSGIDDEYTLVLSLRAELNGDRLNVGDYQKQVQDFVKQINESDILNDNDKTYIKLSLGFGEDGRSEIDTQIASAQKQVDEALHDKILTLNYSDLQIVNSDKFNVDDSTIATWEQLQEEIKQTQIALTEDFTVDSLSDYATNIEAISTSITTYQEALESLESGTFTLSDFMELIAQFPDLADGVDVSSKSFNGLAKNLKKAIRNSPDSLIDDLEDLRARLLEAGKSTDVIDQLIVSLENMPEDTLSGVIDEYGTLTDQITQATQAQNKLKEAMEENPNEGFETRGSAIEQMKTLMEQGMIGSESELWSIAEAFGFTYDSAKSINDNADALYNFITAREKWYAADKDGNYTFDGTESFINAVEKASQSEEFKRILNQQGYEGVEFKWDYENGKLDFDFGNADWDAIIFALSQTKELAGLTSEEFFDLLVQVGQFFEINWANPDDAIAYFQKIAESTEDPKKKLEEYAKLMEKIFGQNSQLDLSNRPVVSGKGMQEAGWTNVPENSEATVYSGALSNEDGTKTIVTTPILPDGNVLTPQAWQEYTNGILEAGDASEYKFEYEGQKYTGSDIFLAGFEGENSIDRANEYSEALHQVQEIYYDLLDDMKDPLQIDAALDKSGLDGLSKIAELTEAISKNGDLTVVDEGAFRTILQDAGYATEDIDALIKKIQEYQQLERKQTDPLGIKETEASIESVLAALDELGIVANQVIDRSTGETTGIKIVDVQDFVTTLKEKGWSKEEIAEYIKTLQSEDNEVKVGFKATPEEINKTIEEAFPNTTAEIAGMVVYTVDGTAVDEYVAANKEAKVLYTPDGEAVALYNPEDKSAQVLYTADGTSVTEYIPEDKGAQVLYDVDGTAIALYDPEDKDAKVLYTADGTAVSDYIAENKTAKVIYNADGSAIALYNPEDKVAEILYTPNGSAITEYMPENKNAQVLYTADGTCVALYSPEDKNAKVLYTADGTAVDNYVVENKNAQVIYTADGTAIALYNPDNKSAHVLYTADGTALSQYIPDNKSAQVLYSANGELIALYNPETKNAEVLYTVDGTAVADYVPDGKDAVVLYTIDDTAAVEYNPDDKYAKIIYTPQYNGSDQSDDDNDDDNTVFKYYGRGGFYVDGTAHANGTAYQSGSWGAEETETALVGELGPELRVRGNQWTLIGQNGAEFTDIRKGDIVFNHKQTESLLANGYVTGRGKAYASGNAFASGSGSFKKYTFSDTSGSEIKNSASKLSKAASDLSKASDELSDDFKEIFDWIEVRIEEITEDIDLKSAELENTIGASKQNAVIDDMIDLNKKLYDNLIAGSNKYHEYAAKLLAKVPAEYRAAAQDGSIAIESFTGTVGESTLEAIQDYREWVQKGDDLTQQAEETLTEIASLAKQAIDNIAQDYENKLSIPEGKISQLEAYNDLAATTLGAESAEIYKALMQENRNNIGILEQQRNNMQAELNKRVNAGEIKKYSDAWYEAVNSISEVDTQIIELTTDVNNLQDEINELHWDHFDNLISRLNAISDEADSLIDVLGNKDLVDKDTAEWTDEGVTSLGLYAQKLENAEVQADKYAKEIDYLNENWKQLGYTEQEYVEKLDELKDGQYDAIKAYNDTKKAIVDLNKERVEAIKEGIQREIDAYEKLIDKKKEELDAENDLYGFQKNVANQQKNIADIERKLAALSSDNSASARAQRAKLQAELAEAQQELQDTYYDRSVSDKQEALDKELESFKEEKDKEMEALDEYLENTELVVSDSLAMIQANTSVVYQTLQAMGQEYSLSMADAITSPWADGAAALQAYSEQFGLSMSSTVEELQRVSDEYKRVMDEIANYGSQVVNTVHTNAQTYQAENKAEPAKTTAPAKPAIAVGGKVNAGSAKIYDHYGDTSGEKQYYSNDPIYDVLAVKGDWVQVRHKSLKSGITGWFKKSDIKAYAKGTTGVKKDQLALIDELGEELILRPQNGRMTFLEKGSSVIPADLTANLMELGALDPSAMLAQNKPEIAMSPSVVNNTMAISIDASVGELIHVEHMDGNNLAEVKKVVDNAWNKYMKELNANIRRYTNR